MKKLSKTLWALAFAILGLSVQVQAEIDTTEIDAFQADAIAWVQHGLTVFLAIAGAGLAIVAVRWIYFKIKAAIATS